MSKTQNNLIPVLGTAIVNSPHWIKRLLDSVDYPVENFICFNNNGRGQITEELDNIIAKPHPFIKNMHMTHMPTNIGCSGAWNLIIKSYMKFSKSMKSSLKIQIVKNIFINRHEST